MCTVGHQWNARLAQPYTSRQKLCEIRTLEEPVQCICSVMALLALLPQAREAEVELPVAHEEVNHASATATCTRGQHVLVVRLPILEGQRELAARAQMLHNVAVLLVKDGHICAAKQCDTLLYTHTHTHTHTHNKEQRGTYGCRPRRSSRQS